ncbi:Alpha/Beta hydrolase protein [Lactifluus volemus]|nr:Alpha/Beta hydrolase protein [Lactifluus volemus]
MTAVIPKHLILFHKARRLCIILGGIYIFLVLLGATPFAQVQLLFMHNLKRPFFVQYDMPEKYDLAPFKTHNVRIQTADNETLGAWFTFSDSFYATHKPLLLNDAPTNLSSLASTSLSSRDDLIHTALRTHPTILFLHGTTGTRVVPVRVRIYQAFAARLRANVLALDYRGFADSTGTPSESGLTLDTRAAWDWLRTNGASPDNVLVVGDSLGTGVAMRASAMVRERPRGVVLLSPFSKLETLLDTYHILGLVPLFAPLRVMPYLASKSFHSFPRLRTVLKLFFSHLDHADFVKGFMVHRFDSLAKVVGLKAPLLIVHAEDDQDIPFWHAQMLFDAFVEKHLPRCRK